MGKGDSFHRIYHFGSGIILATSGGIAGGYIICPLLNYLMGTLPVPYDWISSQPEQLRLTVFLTGAFGLFTITSLFTIGTCAAILGYIFKTNIALMATLIFLSSATTYCCFILDKNILTDFDTWLMNPMSWFYASELVALLLLCISMSWLGSTLRWIREYCQENTRRAADSSQQNQSHV